MFVKGLMSVSPSFRTVQRQQLVDQVIQGLRQRIVAGEFPLGQRLPTESELMAQFLVGRSTIREAVRALAHTGLLEVRQGDGTYVRALSEDTEPLSQRLRRARLVEVHEVRRALELEIARLAALRRDDVDLERLRERLRRRRTRAARGDLEGVLDADVDFHVVVAAATKNAVLADLYQTFAIALREALGELFATLGVNEDRTRLHEDLVDAIEQYDPDRAQAITVRHLDHIAQALNELLLQ